MINRKHLSLCVILLSGKIVSQTNTDSSATKAKTFFQSAPFCNVFVSDIQNYLTKFEFDYSSNSSEYDMSNSSKEYKIFQSTTVGRDFPIFSKYYYKDKKPLYGIGFSAPISFHLWWDPLEESTSPILSTDYRFGTLNFKFIRFFENKLCKNISVKVAPFNHESTHIGDELTIYRTQKKFPITRVNVSYEYSECSITLNDPNNGFDENHAFKFGWIYRLNGTQDFYTMSAAEGDSTLAKATGLKSDFYLEYQYIRTKGILTSEKWINVLSIDLRNRVRYNYPSYTLIDKEIFANEHSEARANSINIYFGWKYHNSKGPTIGLYLHAYAGLNPHGQFRNQNEYKSLGFSLVLE